MMARRPGMAALAAAAGVSVATVDRLLNGREAVAAATREAVLAAALRIGHPAAVRLMAGGGGAMPVIRFGVLLHKQGQEFYQNMAREFRAAVAQLPAVKGSLDLEFSSSQAPSEVAELLRRMAGRCDVIAATAVNHPEITAAVEEVRARGVSVFSLLSDFAQGVRAGYVGLNNLKVGRTAAWMISLAVKGPGRVALFVGGARWHGHDLRETGFRAYLREERPDLEVLESIVNLETRQLTYETTLTLLDRHPDLRGLFVAGGGMEGAIAALQKARRPGEVAVVVNELTAESRAALAQGWVTMVDATPLPDLCEAVLGQMVRAVRDRGPGGAGGNGGGSGGAGQLFLPVQLHVAESL
ncbi:MAG: substrate-binding domain-containing protein [Paracoccaceae bacterium]